MLNVKAPGTPLNEVDKGHGAPEGHEIMLTKLHNFTRCDTYSCAGAGAFCRFLASFSVSSTPASLPKSAFLPASTSGYCSPLQIPRKSSLSRLQYMIPPKPFSLTYSACKEQRSEEEGRQQRHDRSYPGYLLQKGTIKYFKTDTKGDRREADNT